MVVSEDHPWRKFKIIKREIKPYVCYSPDGIKIYPDSKIMDGPGRMIFEHRMIAEKVLGRKLVLNKEAVHHINGMNWDNNKSNLLICENWYHTMLHTRIRRIKKYGHL
jgi:hypothetical protein